ncbi:hypothetical protein HJP15_05950 [Pseudoalteromonas sp. NEC-BIFX-2020_002]|uniref:YcxB-like protein domain-containing protein n=1 Tax=Pseudoalteromonas porphyrae TaxID=187330 RepID=A0A0N1EGQ7_9GAMM|nr:MULTISPECIES: hypothetical protein [Pseudoalteromonas]KPH60157.1 hypothetical protein ADS77_15975 [Pseudoalteromonas porphyrae]NNG42477.1 hypothetical protein [Pseudoalteromonas sp. NEC-BIFX-2020_002]
MQKINQRLALIVACFGIVLLLLSLFTGLLQQPWFVFLIALWVFVFSSCCYRLTSFFKTRNSLDKFIQRDQENLLLFTLTGFFDRTHGPQWLVINTIEKIQCHDDLLSVYSSKERQLSVSLPATKAEILAYLDSLFTAREKQSILIQ